MTLKIITRREMFREEVKDLNSPPLARPSIKKIFHYNISHLKI